MSVVAGPGIEPGTFGVVVEHAMHYITTAILDAYLINKICAVYYNTLIVFA